MLIHGLDTRGFRSIESAELALPAGITTVVGPNGSGKTNLLEALYFGLTGRSFRTSDRRELIGFGRPMARVEVEITDTDRIPHRFLASISRGEGRRHLLDGNQVDYLEAARNRPHVVVFSPDRLSLIKGPPADRRAHIDAYIGARWPSRVGLRRQFGQALAQRNALISRIAARRSASSDLDSWDLALAKAAAPLVAAREDAIGDLSGRFSELAGRLGLPGDPVLAYAPRAGGSVEDLVEGLAERRQADLNLGRTSWGPHLDEIRIEMSAHSIRRYGSQGQQRTALLSLILAEREALLESSGCRPLLLLDDVMSELDREHRELLVERLGSGGQTLITAADAGSVPSAALVDRIETPAALGGDDKIRGAADDGGSDR